MNAFEIVVSREACDALVVLSLLRLLFCICNFPNESIGILQTKIVAPSGIEPESRASETLILSVVLRSQFNTKLKKRRSAFAFCGPTWA